jgi:hypothetical protein
MRAAIALLLCLAGSVVNAQASLGNTTWKVDASWEPDHSFYWTLDAKGRYKDSEGPVGAWSQNGSDLTLTSNGGWIYRCKLAGDYGSCNVFNQASGKPAGSVRFQRVSAP